MNDYDDPNPDLPAAFAARPQHAHRHRRPALLATLALATVATVGVGAGAYADDVRAGSWLLSSRSTANLSTDSATVASSVNGALVDIVTTLGYQNGKAAGTGMILTSTGEILTNNHVVNGATSIKVTVVATGRTYQAVVVGTDPTQDVAVIKLVGASGLRTIPIGDVSAVKVGQKVVASGNAGGVGGTPSVVTGTVTALAQSITAGDEGSSDTEQLTGLIETDAPIVPGDSGGALSEAGAVIGMDTAASTDSALPTGNQSDVAAQAYAIPIRTALTVAQQIEAGQASSTIHLGVHGFLGVELAQQDVSAGFGYYGYGSGYGSGDGYGSGYGDSGTVSGATVGGVVTSGAAASGGLTAGDVITSVDGRTVDGVSTLNTIMAGTRSGQQVTPGWSDASGQSHTATVTLGAAAAD